MTRQARIAIVGAGIAGLTTAAALAAAGTRCEIFEQADRFAEIGAGIQLAPNATRILHRLGAGRLRDHLASFAVRPEALEMRRWKDNSVLRRTPLGQACEDMFGAPYYTMHRADLHEGLAGLVPPGIVHLGLRCADVTETSREVRLGFSGGSAAAADVVLGADGIRSAVRNALSADQPRFSGHSIFRGLVPAGKVPSLLKEPKVIIWLGPGRHCVCYPVRAGQFVSVAATAPAPGGRAESWTAEGRVDDLLAQYAGWNAELTALLSALPAVGRWALHDRDEIERWSTPGITLVGDAAHPMLPFLAQGANQAIEDAAVIAALLGGTDAAAARAALPRYEQIRRPRVREVHRVSRANTDLLHLPDGPGQRQRDRALAGSADLKAQEWLYGYDAGQAAGPG
jgi:salicylate hydroxylase